MRATMGASRSAARLNLIASSVYGQTDVWSRMAYRIMFYRTGFLIAREW